MGEEWFGVGRGYEEMKEAFGLTDEEMEREGLGRVDVKWPEVAMERALEAKELEGDFEVRLFRCEKSDSVRIESDERTRKEYVRKAEEKREKMLTVVDEIRRNSRRKVEFDVYTEEKAGKWNVKCVWEVREDVPIGASDWVGLYIYNRDDMHVDRTKQLKFESVDGRRRGEATFRDVFPAYFNLRYFSGTKTSLCCSEPFVVGERITLNAKVSGREIAVKWSKEDTSAGDWLGVFAETTRSNNVKHAVLKATLAANAKTHKFDGKSLMPGRYVVRYFCKDSYCRHGLMSWYYGYSGVTQPFELH